MSDVAAAMALLQFGDSFFPSGSVAFSWGLEGLAENGGVTDAETVHAFVLGQLHARWAQFDRAVVVLAHRSTAESRSRCRHRRASGDPNALRRASLRLAADGRGDAGCVRPAWNRRRAGISRLDQAGPGVRPCRANARTALGAGRPERARRHRLVRAHILHRAIGRRPPARLPHAYRCAAHPDRGQARGVTACRAAACPQSTS